MKMWVSGRACGASGVVAALFAVVGCASGPPHVAGVAGVAPSPAEPWTPPAQALAPIKAVGPAIAPEAVQDRLDRLTLAEVVDIALANDPVTRTAWADARVAAGNYGAARGEWLPTIDGTATISRANVGSGSAPPWTTNRGPSVSLSWMLFDFGGRAGRVEAAKQTLFAADFTHNAAIQNSIFAVESDFFNYAGAKAILAANRASYAEAESSLAVAEARHDIGMATIANILQARTARAQAKLDVLATEGQLRITKGALAVSMGYPANVSYDIDIGTPNIPTEGVAATVEQLIDQAVAGRPDLQAARARARAAAAQVGGARAAFWPSLSVAGTAGRNWPDDTADPTDRFSSALILDIPLFAGFSRRHELAAAQAAADAARERARGVEQQVIYEVFAAHSDFMTATERVKTSDELLASATESQEVALGRYREGVGDILDLLAAQRALASARAQLINARLGWFTALAELARNAGVLGPHGANPLAPGTLQPEVEK